MFNPYFNQSQAMILRVCILVTFFVIYSACTYKKEVLEEDCSSANISFTNEVMPILRNSCAIGASCHGQGSINGPGELSSYAIARNAASSIRNAVHSGMMPQGSILPEAQKRAIICWIDAGAPDN